MTVHERKSESRRNLIESDAASGEQIEHVKGGLGEGCEEAEYASVDGHLLSFVCYED